MWSLVRKGRNLSVVTTCSIEGSLLGERVMTKGLFDVRALVTLQVLEAAVVNLLPVLGKEREMLLKTC